MTSLAVTAALFRTAAEFSGIEEECLRSPLKRNATHARARHAVWYVLYQRYGMTQPAIAMITGHDTSSVFHGICRAKERIQANEEGMRDLVAALVRANPKPEDDPVAEREARALLDTAGRLAEQVEAMGHVMASAGLRLGQAVEEARLAFEAVRAIERGAA
jgi:hypothetical protein